MGRPVNTDMVMVARNNHFLGSAMVVVVVVR
jgi:hypothetical protein